MRQMMIVVVLGLLYPVEGFAQTTVPIDVVVNIPAGAAIVATNNDSLNSQSAGVFAIGGDYGIKATGGWVGGVFASQTGSGISASGYSSGITATCGSSSCAAVSGISSGGTGVSGHGPMAIVGVAQAWPAGIVAKSWAGYFQGDLHIEGSIDAPEIEQLKTEVANLLAAVAVLQNQVKALTPAPAPVVRKPTR